MVKRSGSKGGGDKGRKLGEGLDGRGGIGGKKKGARKRRGGREG